MSDSLSGSEDSGTYQRSLVANTENCDSGRLLAMTAKKKAARKQSRTKTSLSKKKTRVKRSSSNKSGSRKKAAAKRKAASKRIKTKPRKVVARKKRQTVETVFSGLRRAPARSGQQSGDLQGLSRAEQADSESVDELIEEGNAFEADVVAGVEAADNADQREVHTREVPEDDVPEEYLDKD